jgi:hypothetical protein
MSWPVEVLDQAARGAARSRLWNQAEQLAGLAERLDAPDVGAQLLVTLAQAALDAGDQDPALTLLDTAQLAIDRLDPQVRAVGLLEAAKVAAQLDDENRLVALLDSGERDAGQMDPDLQAETLADYARFASWVKLLERAERLVDRVEDHYQWFRAHIGFVAGLIEQATGEGDQHLVRELLDGYVRLIDEHGSDYRGELLFELARSAAQADEQARAVELLDQALRDFDDPFSTSHQRTSMILEAIGIAAQMGEQAKAEELLDRAQSQADEHDFDQDEQMWMLADVARVAAQVGSWNRAESLAGHLRDRLQQGKLWAGFAVAAAQQKEPTLADRFLDAAEVAAEQLSWSEHVELLVEVARAAAQVGAEPLAQRVATDAAERARLLTDPRQHGQVLAEVLPILAARDPQQASRTLLRALPDSSAPALFGVALDGAALTAIIEELEPGDAI